MSQTLLHLITSLLSQQFIKNAMITTETKRRKGHENLLKSAPEHIIRLEANINYTSFVMQSGKRKIMSYTLAMYGLILPQTFIRVNRSCIINIKFIKNFNSDDKKVMLKDGTEIQISRRRWNEVSQYVAA
jgi:DNA-binding LytR/AlgR family response regulator